MKSLAWITLLLWAAAAVGIWSSKWLPLPSSLSAAAPMMFTALSVVLVVATLVWALVRIARDASQERCWRRTDYGRQADDEFLAAVDGDAEMAARLPAIRQVMADYVKTLDPDQIVAAMPMWAFSAKVGRWDGWDPAELVMAFEDRFDLSLPEAELRLMRLEEAETAGDWVKRVVALLPPVREGKPDQIISSPTAP